MRLQMFLDDSGAVPKHQSTYRGWHSSETALVKVYNNLLTSADCGEVTVLCLVDLRAAFDMMDH